MPTRQNIKAKKRNLGAHLLLIEQLQHQFGCEGPAVLLLSRNEVTIGNCIRRERRLYLECGPADLARFIFDPVWLYLHFREIFGILLFRIGKPRPGLTFDQQVAVAFFRFEQQCR